MPQRPLRTPRQMFHGALLGLTLGATLPSVCAAQAAPKITRSPVAAPADPRDLALLGKMTLQEKINQLMLLSKGTMTGPDSAGRPNISAEELARSGVGFQMAGFNSAKEVNRIQRIAVKES